MEGISKIDKSNNIFTYSSCIFIIRPNLCGCDGILDQVQYSIVHIFILIGLLFNPKERDLSRPPSGIVFHIYIVNISVKVFSHVH